MKQILVFAKLILAFKKHLQIYSFLNFNLIPLLLLLPLKSQKGERKKFGKEFLYCARFRAIWKKEKRKLKMEIDTAPITRCSRENQKIYQEWFSFADSGLSFFFFPSSLWSILKFLTSWQFICDVFLQFQMEMAALPDPMPLSFFHSQTCLAKISSRFSTHFTSYLSICRDIPSFFPCSSKVLYYFLYFKFQGFGW